MTVKRIMAIGLILALVSSGWNILGYSTKARSGELAGKLGDEVQRMWGGPLTQKAPAFATGAEGSPFHQHLLPSANVVDVNLELEHRRKGLIWYSTYVCDFDGTYTLTNTTDTAQSIDATFEFPDPAGTYDQFLMAVDGERLNSPVNPEKGIRQLITVPPGEARTFQIAYRTRGLGEWRYQPDPETRRIHGFDLNVTTNFADIDFPAGSLSPNAKAGDGDGAALSWKAADLLTSQGFGVVMPDRLNPGPLVGRITYFAPVCLLFFFVLITAISIIRDIRIHPMHYLFVAAGFFAFHLLFAYLVDVINVHAAFAASAVTTVVLVTGYLAAALGPRFPAVVACAGQLCYLILFSYSFFFDGMTGLTVTIGSIATLAALMKLTAKTDWEAVFAPDDPKPSGPPPLKATA